MDQVDRLIGAISLLVELEWSVEEVTPVTEEIDESYKIHRCPTCKGVKAEDDTPVWLVEDFLCAKFGHDPACRHAKLIGAEVRAG